MTKTDCLAPSVTGRKVNMATWILFLLSLDDSEENDYDEG